MLRNTFILISLSIMTIGTVTSQKTIELFKNQDYAAITAQLSEDVELKADKGTKIKGITAVAQTLKEKLTAFAPVRIETRHKGSSEEDAGDYQIGKLYNAQGEGLRLFVHLENTAEGRRICAIKLRAI